MKIKYQILMLLLVYSCFCSRSYSAQPLDRIVAVVNGEIITWSELFNRVKLITEHLTKQQISLPQRDILEKQVLNKIILEQIQLQLAKKFSIDVDSITINGALADLAKNQKTTITEYKEKIESEGMDFQEFRKQIKTEITLARLQQKEVGSEVRVYPSEIEAHLKILATQDNNIEYRLGHILIADPEKADPSLLNSSRDKVDQIIKDLKQGKDFKQMAIKFSSGTQSLDGGDLGWRKINEIPNIFVKYVTQMQVNEVVGPIKNSSGLHIIKLHDKRSGIKNNYQEFYVRQILIKPGDQVSEQEALKELTTLRKQIVVDGKDFAKLARSRSEEITTSVKGGDLGWININSTIPDFWQEVIKLKPGEISEPFSTELGCHLLQLLRKRDLTNSKEVMRRHAMEILKEQKFNELLEIWLKRIKDQAKIQIFL